MYDLPEDILTTLTRKYDGEPDQAGQEELQTSSAKAVGSESRTENAVGSKSCSLCGVTFHTVEDQRSHVRSDLHGYNLKQRIRGANPVTEGDFEKLVEGMRVLQCPRDHFADIARS